MSRKSYSVISPRTGQPMMAHPERWKGRHESLRNALRIVRYLELSGSWVSTQDLAKELNLNARTVRRYMTAIESVYGLQVRGGEYQGAALLWRFPR